MERMYNDQYGHFEYLWPTGLTEILSIQGSNFTYIKENEDLYLSNEILIGAHNKRFTLKNSGPVKIIGIRAYNHGANLLFGIDANVNKSTIHHFQLEKLDKEKLFNLEPSEVADYLNDYCITYRKEEELLDVLFKIYKKEHLSVEELSQEAHLSERQFERKVKEFTSFTPSELKKIIRFDKARLNMIFTRDYMQAMNDMGYYDYSHFSRDFKKYYDVTPKQFIEMLPFYGK
ncbi:AraC family transcriptional regulator [Sporolactobacillus sp. THM7-4]|nr:AraC family transcriptional regulator [Sporolactobacillus sp. THM7-4]